MKRIYAPLLLLSVAATQPSADESAIRTAEAVWHGSATAENLAGLLAEDFARPMPSGQIWGKNEQIAWLKDRPAPPGFTGKTERLDVRLYGDAAVATGIAVIFDPSGKEVDRTIFTDVYTKRGGKWLMVSAQSGPVTRAQAK
jgi:hypothetical protein